MKKHAKVVVIFVIVLAILLALVCVNGKNEMESKVKGIKIEMMHDTALYVPNEYASNLVHERETNGTVTTDVFYMQIGDTKTGIYRFDFGSEEAGDWLGILQDNEGDVLVTYTVFAHPEEAIRSLGENATEIYNALMNSFNDAVNRICADSRYVAKLEADLGEDQQVTMTYWTVTLRGSMSWAETVEEETYKATIYGMIQGKRVALYSVYIGDVGAEAVLGMFEIDGMKKPVSIETYELDRDGTWEEEDYTTANRMMDTINDVIDAIMQSKQFSTEAE